MVLRSRRPCWGVEGSRKLWFTCGDASSDSSSSSRHTNPIVENGQSHPCQKVIQEVS